MAFAGLFALGFILGALLVGLGLSLQFKNRHFHAQQLLLQKDAELQAAQLLNQQTQQSMQLMGEKFELLAGKVLEEKSLRFQDQNLKNLAVVLDPFKERLKEFEKKVEDSYSQERSERGSLRGELSKLMELNLRMSSDAESLTKALRGDTRTQGAWGEMVLESILERSGLRKGQEYSIQGLDVALKNEDGGAIRPDVIVHLPEAKHIIIDAKVSLTAYDQYMSSDDPAEKERLSKLHAESLRRHVDGLAARKYHTADLLNSPDFVIMFMPVEPAFSLAMKVRSELQQEAWDKRIAIVSPTTLLVTLKMIAALWKTERQERNALEIAEKGGQLYDKFVGLVTDLEMVGKKMDDAQKAQAAVMGKLKDGKGNLLRQVDQLRELGVKTSKRLNLDKSSDSAVELIE